MREGPVGEETNGLRTPIELENAHQGRSFSQMTARRLEGEKGGHEEPGCHN